MQLLVFGKIVAWRYKKMHPRIQKMGWKVKMTLPEKNADVVTD
jgi:hypothetical protein